MTLKPEKIKVLGMSITSQDKTTIPKRVRDELGVTDGTYLLYELDDESNKIKISRS